MDILRISCRKAFAQAAILAYCAICGEGCSEKPEKWSDSSATAIAMVTNLLQSAAECVGKPIYTDPKWKQSLQQCKKLDDHMFAVADMRERLRLAAWLERSIYTYMESQTNNVATLEVYYSTLKTIDSLINVLWKTTDDTNLVLGVWESFHRKARAVASSCEEDWKKLEPEYKRLNRYSRHFDYRLSKVSKRELTPREKEMFKEVQEKLWPTRERYRYLDYLVNGYRRTLVDAKGWNMDNGELCARFTQLPSDERDRLAAYTIEEYIARHMRKCQDGDK